MLVDGSFVAQNTNLTSLLLPASRLAMLSSSFNASVSVKARAEFDGDLESSAHSAAPSPVPKQAEDDACALAPAPADDGTDPPKLSFSRRRLSLAAVE